ncbi:BrnT family toxin (plasmid) [Kozakia baliensis]|uniref:BrnT family toxin n=1 Tax=Kozakia baliensis TaxID=153496 RepID=UPI00345C546A
MTGSEIEFEWDDAKSDACLEERGFDFEYATQVFLGPLIEKADERKDYGEARFRVAGLIEGVPFMVVYTLRGDAIRIISARKMHQREWIKWQE